MEMLETEMMSKKGSSSTLPVIILLLLLAGAAYFFFSNRETAPVTEQQIQSTTITPTDGETIMTQGTKAISINGSNFSFDPSTITVKKGDTVRITLSNKDSSDEFEITHDFVIDELGVQSEEIGEGETTTFEFVANQTGSFEYYCSVGEHRDMGMEGTLTVTE